MSSLLSLVGGLKLKLAGVAARLFGDEVEDWLCLM